LITTAHPSRRSAIPGVALGLFAALAVAGLPTRAGNPQQDAPTLKGQSGHYQSSIIVRTTPSRAWAVITDYESQAGWTPDIKKAKVKQRLGHTVQLEQVYQAPYTFGKSVRAVLEMQESPKTSIKYKLLEADDIRDLHGTWTLTPVKQGIRLTHQIQINPKVPALLRPIYDELHTANLLQWMRLLKQRMEAAETKRATD